MATLYDFILINLVRQDMKLGTVKNQYRSSTGKHCSLTGTFNLFEWTHFGTFVIDRGRSEVIFIIYY